MQTARETRWDMTQNKLLLLYALTGLGPVTSEQALRFVTMLDLMGYMDYALALAELAEAQLLLALDEEPGRTYRITRRGAEVLDLFLRRVPGNKLASIDESMAKWRETFRHERRYRADILPCPTGLIAVRMTARTAAEPIADLTLYVSRRDQAEAIAAAWPDRAGDIYRIALRELLRGDAEDS